MDVLDNNAVSELKSGDNLAYNLENSALFSLTEYKVLQGQTDGLFIKCMKLLSNGKIQLYYLINGLMPFDEMLSSLDADKFLMVVGNIFSGIMAVRGNGFLSCQNIDVSLSHIFVDLSTYKISFIYLPISKKLFADLFAFGDRLRTSLVKAIQSTPALSSPKTTQLMVDLSNGSLSFDELCVRNCGSHYSPSPGERGRAVGITSNNRTKAVGRLKIVAVNAPVPFELVIEKDEFVLGRKQELVDGVISYNRMIGRTHCKILKTSDCYAIVDLNSSNGTYVNGIRIEPNQPYPLKNGDMIRLANSEFQIIIS